MKGYWKDVARTNDVINDGWMHTGDLGVFDREGFCTITGRLKDMIIRGGENIYPREIEEFLFCLILFRASFHGIDFLSLLLKYNKKN